jgi:hypothetical protein
LRDEIKNLKVNLKINKEIIEGMFNYRDNNDKNVFYMSKLKEENEKINKQLEIKISECEDLRSKVDIFKISLVLMIKY